MNGTAKKWLQKVKSPGSEIYLGALGKDFGWGALSPEDAQAHARWKAASGHPGGWRVVRGISPLEELEDAAGNVRLFPTMAAAEEQAAGLNQAVGEGLSKDFILSKARKRAELADYLEEIVLPELASYGEDKTWGFQQLIALLRMKPAPDRGEVAAFKRRLLNYTSILKWAGLETQAEDLVNGADLLEGQVVALEPKQEGRAKEFLRTVNVGNLPGFDAFYRAYVEAALWVSTTEDGTALDRIDAEIDDRTEAAMRKDCLDFYGANRHLMDDPSQGGHDFWLTRNRHGTGFWDRDDLSDETATALTDAAHAFGEVNLDWDPEQNVIYQV